MGTRCYFTITNPPCRLLEKKTRRSLAKARTKLPSSLLQPKSKRRRRLQLQNHRRRCRPRFVLGQRIANSPGPVYTLQCFAGTPGKALTSYIKSSKKANVQELLRKRGLDTTGTKDQLLHRLQTELPSVTFELDGRECLQPLVHTFLHYFGWDAYHLFRIGMPRRGSIPDGAMTLRDSIPGMCDLTFFGVKQYFEEYGLDMDTWPVDQRAKNHLLKNLEIGKFTMQAMHRACTDPDALGPDRVLSGSAFDPMTLQGQFNLRDLEIQQGDVLNVEYDFGDENIFTIKVLKVEESKVIAEETQGFFHTRAKLVSRGKARIRNQYR